MKKRLWNNCNEVPIIVEQYPHYHCALCWYAIAFQKFNTDTIEVVDVIVDRFYFEILLRAFKVYFTLTGNCR